MEKIWKGFITQEEVKNMSKKIKRLRSSAKLCLEKEGVAKNEYEKGGEKIKSVSEISIK